MQRHLEIIAPVAPPTPAIFYAATAPSRSTREGKLGESRIDLYRVIEDEQPFGLFLMKVGHV